MGEVDLERLAAGYRHRPASRASLRRAAAEASAAGLGPGTVALDVGGGRGEHAAVFAGTGAVAVVLDRSGTMAAAAGRRPGVAAVVGDARRMPVRDAVASLVYFHVSLHYGGWETMLAEAARVARPDGVVSVWTFSTEHFGASFPARWFPSVPAIDRERFPEPSAVAARLAALGLSEVTVTAGPEEVERRAGDWAAAAAAGFISTLQLLPPGELAGGLARFREAHPDPDERLRYILDYRRIAGRVPRLR
jgi:SAM-dependent methyltransferase